MTKNDLNISFLIVHPLSFGRGVLLPMLSFLSRNDILIGNIKEIDLCSTSASVLGWKYNSEGWPRSYKTVAMLLYSTDIPDDLISRDDITYNDIGDLKRHLSIPYMSVYDAILKWTDDQAEVKFYRNLFTL